MKYMKWIVVLLAVLIIVGALNFQPVTHTKKSYLLDTYVTVTVYGNHEKAVEDVMKRVWEIDKMFSVFRAGSEIDKINQSERKDEVEVSEECFQLISRALNLCYQTDGAFDITVKPVMDLWDFGGAPVVPPDDMIREKLKAVDYREVALDEENRTVSFQKKGMQIDLGGIAKGYAADCAVKILQDAGVEVAVLDFGGNVVTIGERPLSLWNRIKNGGKKTKPFSIGIQSPGETRGTVAETVKADMSPFAVVTSGGYERCFTEDGKTYHHILDPKTGKQPENGIASVTVIAQDSVVADALSTALFVSGEEGLSLVEGLYEEVIFITEDGEVKHFTKE